MTNKTLTAPQAKVLDTIRATPGNYNRAPGETERERTNFTRVLAHLQRMGLVTYDFASKTYSAT